MRRVYPRGTRRLVTCHARCHGGARICQRTYERDALQGGAWYHGHIRRICRQKYDDSRPTAGAMGGSLQQPPAAMLEISRRHSVMLHGSCIPSFEIERATMNCHDQRGPSRASLHGLRSQVALKKTDDEKSRCFQPLPGPAWYSTVSIRVDFEQGFFRFGGHRPVCPRLLLGGQVRPGRGPEPAPRVPPEYPKVPPKYPQSTPHSATVTVAHWHLECAQARGCLT